MDAGSTHEVPSVRRVRPWYAQLWVQVLLATIAGVALGYWQPELGAKMEPLGDAFIKAIRVIIAPVIFCTVVHGIARMSDMARVGRVAIKALLYFEVMTTWRSSSRSSPSTCSNPALA